MSPRLAVSTLVALGAVALAGCGPRGPCNGEYCRNVLETTQSYELIHALWGASPDSVWMAGRESYLFHWTNGKLEQRTGLSGDSGLVYAIQGSSERDIWMATHNVARHYDGTTWSDLPASTSFLAVNLYPEGPGRALVADGVAVKKASLNAPPVTVIASGQCTFNDVYVSPSGRAWAVGGDPYGVKGCTAFRSTRDGTWTLTKDDPRFNALWTVHGSGEDVWAAGQDGALVHWNGTDWTVIPPGSLDPSGVIDSFTDVWVGANGEVFLATGGQWLYHLDKAGTWALWRPPGQEDFLKSIQLDRVWGFDSGDLWITGSYFSGLRYGVAMRLTRR